MSPRASASGRYLANVLAPLDWPERLRTVNGYALDLIEDAITRVGIADLQAGSNIRYRAPEGSSFQEQVDAVAAIARSTISDALVLLGEPQGVTGSGAEAALYLLTNRPVVQNAGARWFNENGVGAFCRAVAGCPGIGLLMLAASFGRTEGDPDPLLQVTGILQRKRRVA